MRTVTNHVLDANDLDGAEIRINDLGGAYPQTTLDIGHTIHIHTQAMPASELADHLRRLAGMIDTVNAARYASKAVA